MKFGVMRLRTWQADKKYADQFKPQLALIFQECKGFADVVEWAGDDEDRHGIDLIGETFGCRCACRVRGYYALCRFRDVTVRWKRPTGASTEWDKLPDHVVDWYLWAWEEYGVIKAWVFCDVDKMISEGIFQNPDRWRQVINADGTKGLAIPLSWLSAHGCIIKASGVARFIPKGNVDVYQPALILR